MWFSSLVQVSVTETRKHMSDLSAGCRISSVFFKRKDKAGQDFFRYAPKYFNANSLFCILQALAIYSGDEIKAHVRDAGDVRRKEEYIQIFGRNAWRNKTT